MTAALIWIWNGCQPGFPWWCDGFVWMVMTLGVLLITVVVWAFR